MKKNFSKREYMKLYPSSSRPGLFFGLAKVHKLREDAFNVDSLPLRPVISNIGTATYEISKYLASLLQPLTKNEYTIDSTKHFIERLRGRSIPAEYEMVSFDVLSLILIVVLTSDKRHFGFNFYSDPLSLTEYNSKHPKASFRGFYYFKLQNQAHLIVPKCWL